MALLRIKRNKLMAIVVDIIITVSFCLIVDPKIQNSILHSFIIVVEVTVCSLAASVG